MPQCLMLLQLMTRYFLLNTLYYCKIQVKWASLISNPQNEIGKKILREKFNLPAPTVNRSRTCGKKELSGKVYTGKSISR